MAYKKNANAPVQKLVEDDAVGTYFSDESEAVSRKREEVVSTTPAKRKKKEYDKRRNRKMIDLPRDLEEIVKATAAELKVPESQVLVYWAIRGAGVVGMEEMEDALQNSRSMRYQFTLRFPKVPKPVHE